MQVRVFVAVLLIAVLAPLPTHGAAQDEPKARGAAQEPLDAAAPPPQHRDVARLPAPVRETVEAISAAARSGDLARMQMVLEMNEIPPIVTRGPREPALAYWRRVSADGTGRDVLAAILEAIEAGFAMQKTGETEMYVFPYFANARPDALTPEEQVDLFRLASADEVKAMRAAGAYSGWRIGIAADGIWHYALMNAPQPGASKP
jgi:hypothetical protein